jgi:glycosyltransferase involved in cell wall biosynthesis
MKKIKLCLISHLYPADLSDYKGVFVKDLAVSLASKGNEVHVVTPMRPGASVYEFADNVHVNRFRFFGWKKGQQLGQVNGLPLIMLGSLVLAGLVKTVNVSFVHKPDLLHAYWVVPGGFIAAVAGWIIRIPSVATAAGSDLNIAARNKMIARFATVTFRLLAALICVSRPLMKTALDLGMVRSKVIHIPGPVGIDMQTYASPACEFPRTSDPLQLLYVGNLEAPKRVDTLIRAAANLNSQSRDFQLTIAGTGPLEEKLKQLATALGLENRVTFKGRVPHDQVPALLQICHVFWHCSENEGLPVAIMEAMAAGLPVIAAKVGGIPELVQSGISGFCLPFEDAAGFAAKTMTLHDDDALRRRMGQQARHWVGRRFGRDRIIGSHVSLYRHVLNQMDVCSGF